MMNNKIADAILYGAMVAVAGYGLIKFTIVIIDFLR
tara:strand:+ start:274 stop:381 length:108 start_codon:yes stop_codon:yes gene_type:complete